MSVHTSESEVSVRGSDPIKGNTKRLTRRIRIQRLCVGKNLRESTVCKIRGFVSPAINHVQDCAATLKTMSPPPVFLNNRPSVSGLRLDLNRQQARQSVVVQLSVTATTLDVDIIVVEPAAVLEPQR